MDTARHHRRFRWLHSLLGNSRFWILALAITLSVNIAGFIQFLLPSSSLQTIRIEQTFGFISFGLLYLALMISPVTQVFSRLPGKAAILHARRAIGVSAFYYAMLHTLITFFGQLNGFAGIHYLNSVYRWSLICGIFALAVLSIMAATSLDVVVKKMGYRRWKLLHRLIYTASLTLLVHVLLLGPHFDNGLTLLGGVTYAAAAVLVVFEALRVFKVARRPRA